jgi:hypothetical protein
VHKRPNAEPNSSLWFTLFDAQADSPRASKATLPQPAAGEGAWIRIGDGRLGPGEAVGSAVSERCEASWELRFDTLDEPLEHLPREWMYRAPVPRTKTLSPVPAAAFSGRVTVDGRDITLDNWPGMVGHNWGSEHAERWIWMHGLGFPDEGAGTWLDVAIGRVKLGRWTTPWIASGAISLDGQRTRLGGPGKRVSVRETPERCEFELPGKGLTVKGTLEAARKDVVGWPYADPAGGDHSSLNCSIADLELHVDGRELRLPQGAAYELGVRERDHGVELQPFPDG